MAAVALVVNDPKTAAHRRALRVLAELGFTVRPAASPDEALVAAGAGPFDLVLVHVSRVDKPFRNFVRELRTALAQFPGAGAGAIVAAVDSPHAVERVAQVGVDEILSWPLSAGEVRFRLDRLDRGSENKRAALIQWPGASVGRRVMSPGAVLGAGAAMAGRSAAVGRQSSLAPVYQPDSGRVDAKRLASLFGLELTELARAIGRPYKALAKTPDAPAAQPALRPLARIADILQTLYGGPGEVRAWLNAMRPELRNQSPLEVITAGKGGAVLTLLENVVHGLPV